MGGDGCISVLSNVVPNLCVRIDRAWRDGERDEARRIAGLLGPLTAALFADSNPVPVKFALSLMGHMRADVRLPLCETSDLVRAEVVRALDDLNLLERPDLSHLSASVGRRPLAGVYMQGARHL
jgi:4-hydroxy-tetrahydrodipicolinate synthase